MSTTKYVMHFYIDRLLYHFYVRENTCFKAGIFFKANNRMIILKIIYIYTFIERLLHKIMIFKTEPQKYLDRNRDSRIKFLEII